MSKILSLNDIRSLLLVLRYDDLSAESQRDLIATAERYACAIERSWAVSNYCKHCGAIIQEWAITSTKTAEVCHHKLDCVVMQVKGAG